MKLSSICTILDKPKHTQVALREALRLREVTDCRLELVSFYWNSLVENRSAYDAKQRRSLHKALLAQHDEWLETLRGRYPGMPEVRTIWEHDIARWVAGYCEESKPSLVLKTAHKSQTLTHTPTDWNLLRTCPVPVLLAATGRRRKSSQSVLAALDLTHNDAKHRRLNQKVLAAAHVFAQAYGDPVECVFAAEISPVLRDLDLVDARLSKKKLTERVAPELERLLKPYDIPRSRVHIPVGKVGQAVAQTARKRNARLLVLGSYTHRFKQALGLGNSAEKILVKSPCDVLAVHP
jgi:universal stress protein E